MSRHNVRVKAISTYGLNKNENKGTVNNRHEKFHIFTKISMDKQALKERYIKLMNDAEKAVGRKEAIYLFRDAENVWQKLNG